MAERCLLAISGTPGVGKSQLCNALGKQGWEVLRLVDLAEQYGCLGEVDERDGAAPVDIHRLEEVWDAPGAGRWVIDGHLSHLLEVDGVVLLRCSPPVLSNRLEGRSYAEEKIRSNVEWELVAGHWSELLEFEVATPVLELDSTDCPTNELLEHVEAWVDENLAQIPTSELALSAIDWLTESTA